MFICTKEPWSKYINRCRTWSVPSTVINLTQLIRIYWQKPLTLLSVFYNVQSCGITQRQYTVEITQMVRKLWIFCACFSFSQFFPTVKKLMSWVLEACIHFWALSLSCGPSRVQSLSPPGAQSFHLTLFMFRASVCDTIWTKQSTEKNHLYYIWGNQISQIKIQDA